MNPIDGSRPQAAAARLDRSHHRQHVQRQERRADPPAAPRADRPAEGPDLQAARRRPLQRRPHRLAQRHADRVARTCANSDELRAAGRTTTPKSSGIDEGQFFDPNLPAACNTLADRGQAGDRRRARPGLPRAVRSSRCRSCWRSPNTSPRRWPSASSAAIPANHTQRLVASSDRVLVGATGLYEARCRHCFDPTLAGDRADLRHARR